MYTVEHSILEGTYFWAANCARDALFSVVHNFMGTFSTKRRVPSLVQGAVSRVIQFYYAALINGTISKQGVRSTIAVELISADFELL